MFLINISRLIKYAIQGFFRNFWLSFICITTIVFAFILIDVLGGLGIVSNDILNSVKNKIDVSIYLKNDVTEDQAYAIKTELSILEGVKSVSYVSKKDALESFKARHDKNDALINSINTLDYNPIGSTLIIKAESVDNYSDILDYISTFSYKDLVEETDYTDNRLIIKKINDFNNSLSKVILGIGLFFGFISAITVFNTLRITIYSRRREIEVMRFLGASRSFIKVPFILEGIFYLLFGWIISVAIFYILLSVATPYSSLFFSFYELNIVNSVMEGSINIILFQFVAGLFITVFSSLMSVRKYAKV